ncbi:hypothetical protein D3C87_1983950 [compost metagenome]
MKSMVLGALKPAMRVRAKAMMSAGSWGAPDLRATTALTASPQVSSGTPITATSATCGWP